MYRNKMKKKIHQVYSIRFQIMIKGRNEQKWLELGFVSYLQYTANLKEVHWMFFLIYPQCSIVFELLMSCFICLSIARQLYSHGVIWWESIAAVQQEPERNTSHREIYNTYITVSDFFWIMVFINFPDYIFKLFFAPTLPTWLPLWSGFTNTHFHG